MSLEEIHAAIPHRPPMLLVDEIVERNDRRIVCTKTFRADEFFFQGHYPAYPLVPGVILCESAMQAGAILLRPYVNERGDTIPVVGRMNAVKFKQMVRPGQCIRMEVDLTERVRDAFFLSAKVSSNGNVAVMFEFVCTLAAVEPPS